MTWTARPVMGASNIYCWFTLVFTFTPAPKYRLSTTEYLPTLYLYHVFSHCVISTLRITSPKVPAVHFSIPAYTVPCIPYLNCGCEQSSSVILRAD